MANKTHRIMHLLKVANEGDYLQKTPQKGIVHLHRNKNKEWGYIYVNKELFTQRRADMLGESIGEWKLPDILPHISIFTKDEIKRIPEGFEIPKEMESILTGEVKKIKPKDWIGVSECIFETVICKEIIKIRKSLKFTPFMFENHEYHITLGIKKEKA